MSLGPINNAASTFGSTGASSVQARPSLPPATSATSAAATATPTITGIAPATPEQAQRSNSSARLDQAVDAINQFLKPLSSSIEFSIDEESGRTLVKVVDTETMDVLRQFPSKEALAISSQLDKLQGLLVRDKA